MRVLCRNSKCPFNNKLADPEIFKFRKNHYVPLGNSDKVYGQCVKEVLDINYVDFETYAGFYKLAVCVQGSQNEYSVQKS